MTTRTKKYRKRRTQAARGLPIIESCDGCGVCCMEQESPPGYLVIACGHEEAYCSDDEERWHTMPDEARQLILDYAESLGRGEPHPNNDICIWFDEGSRKCRYYEWRPDICRETLQVGDDACRAWRESYAHLID